MKRKSKVERIARHRLEQSSLADREFARHEGETDAERTSVQELTAPYLPSPAELAERTAAVREAWDATTERHRRGGLNAAYEIPTDV